MVYITYKQPLKFKQLTFEEIMAGIEVSDVNQLRIGDGTGTRTVCTTRVPRFLVENTDVNNMIRQINDFNTENKDFLDMEDKSSLYRTFHVPKKSGHGFREINAPAAALKNAQRTLKTILSGFMLADYHTNAFAYIKGRCAIDAVKKHQQWGSKWFLKLDFHDFFGSNNLPTTIHCLERIYPFCMILERTDGREALSRALTICFLNGKLPQGTPISPFITNVIMIPFDHKVTNALHKFDMGDGRTERFVYTRYADDIDISCRVGFRYKKLEKYIIDSLAWMGAPFTLNTEKTHYGNSNGRNWMLGVMLNKDNEITIGHKAKRELKAAVANYLRDKKNGKPWDLGDIKVLRGIVSYYLNVEHDTILELINEKSKSLEMDFFKQIAEDEANSTNTSA